MKRIFLLSFLLALVFSTVSAQNYTGRNTIHFGSEDVNLTSQQAICQWNAEQQQFGILMKTVTMSFGADANAKDFLMDVMLMDVNPLFQLKMDVSEAIADEENGLHADASITFNSKTVPFPATLSIEEQENGTLSIKFECDIKLADLGVILGGEYADFSPMMKFSIKSGTMNPRG